MKKRLSATKANANLSCIGSPVVMTTASVQEMGHAARGGCNRPASAGGSMSDARVNRPQEGNNDSDAKEFSQNRGHGCRGRQHRSIHRQDVGQGVGNSGEAWPA